MPAATEVRANKSHILIAGTGRAGTTFLVQLLAACGLETELDHSQIFYDNRANAGLETIPLEPESSPYVLKSPWAYQFLDRKLSEGKLRLDAVIIPFRNLIDACASRVIVELHGKYADRGHPVRDLEDEWSEYGAVAGGVLYSIEPLDQQRILAVAVYRTIEACVKHQVPMIFIDHPKFAADPNYCFDQLKPILPNSLAQDDFFSAFFKVADSKKNRTSHEISALRSTASVEEANSVADGPTLKELDRIAILRMMRELESQLDAARAEVHRSKEAMASAARELEAVQQQLTLAQKAEQELKVRLSVAAGECEAFKLRLSEFEAVQINPDVPMHERIAKYLKRSKQR